MRFLACFNFNNNLKEVIYQNIIILYFFSKIPTTTVRNSSQNQAITELRPRCHFV